MLNAIDIAVSVGIAAIVLLVIIIVVALLLCSPKTTTVRPRKASLPPLHWGYKPRQDGGGPQVNPNPPKAPEGAGGGSH